MRTNYPSFFNAFPLAGDEETHKKVSSLTLSAKAPRIVSLFPSLSGLNFVIKVACCVRGRERETPRNISLGGSDFNKNGSQSENSVRSILPLPRRVPARSSPPPVSKGERKWGRAEKNVRRWARGLRVQFGENATAWGERER